MNNAAVAAAHALINVDRVAIIDWDTHHGNGTQNIFYDSNNVLYCSVHQNDTFPHTGFIGETGRHEGEGFTINAPLKQNSGIADYVSVFSEIFMPALQKFRPDLVIISAGQDMLSDDPLESMNLVPTDLSILTAMVRDAAEQSLTFVLEGGYGPSHPEAIRIIFDTLEKTSPAKMPDSKPDETTLETVRLLKKLHRL
jgi:acetoin utilization deacetylase AcuC-like enzyme